MAFSTACLGLSARLDTMKIAVYNRCLSPLCRLRPSEILLSIACHSANIFRIIQHSLAGSMLMKTAFVIYLRALTCTPLLAASLRLPVLQLSSNSTSEVHNSSSLWNTTEPNPGLLTFKEVVALGVAKAQETFKFHLPVMVKATPGWTKMTYGSDYVNTTVFLTDDFGHQIAINRSTATSGRWGTPYTVDSPILDMFPSYHWPDIIYDLVEVLGVLRHYGHAGPWESVGVFASPTEAQFLGGQALYALKNDKAIIGVGSRTLDVIALSVSKIGKSIEDLFSSVGMNTSVKTRRLQYSLLE